MEQGETIVIARAGKPVAELAAVRPRADFVFGTLKDRITYDDASWETDKAEIAAEFDDEDEFH